MNDQHKTKTTGALAGKKALINVADQGIGRTSVEAFVKKDHVDGYWIINDLSEHNFRLMRSGRQA